MCFLFTLKITFQKKKIMLQICFLIFYVTDCHRIDITIDTWLFLLSFSFLEDDRLTLLK